MPTISQIQNAFVVRKGCFLLSIRQNKGSGVEEGLESEFSVAEELCTVGANPEDMAL